MSGSPIALSYEPDWKYERSGIESDSIQRDRIFFFESIQRLRCETVSDLLKSVYPSFISFVEEVYRQHIHVDPHSVPTWREVFRVLRCIPERAVRSLDWKRSAEIPSGRILQDRLEMWGRGNHLSEEWCYDFAIKVMISWMYSSQIWWDGFRSESPKVLHNGFVPWTEVLRTMEWSLASSRVFFSHELSVAEDLPFTFEDWFKYPAWNYLDQGRHVWQVGLEMRFQQILAELRLAGNPIPKAALSRLRKEIRTHLKEQDKRRLANSNGSNMTKLARHYAKTHSKQDHFDWLVKYQIPPVAVIQSWLRNQI